MNTKKKWLITVQGYDPATGHDSTKICSKVIELDESKFSSPIEWFLSKPKLSSNIDWSELKINALLNFWPIN